MQKPIQEQQIIEILKATYGIEAQSARLLPLGADMNASVYKVDANSNSYFLKIKQGHHEKTNLAVIAFLHDSGIKEIIYPLVSIDGTLLKQFDHFKMIAYPFIEGQNGFEQPLTKSQWIALGKTLKKIHTASVPLSIQKQLRKETYSPKWREIVKALAFQIEQDTSNNNITADFKNYYKKNFNAISRLVSSAEALCKKIQPNSNNVLCHSDIHAGNILITPEGSFYIVDWDEPVMAPKERDLMFIGGGVGNVWNVSNEVGYFYEGYGQVDIDKTILSYYRHERIIEDIAWYGQDILSDNQNDQAKQESFNLFKSLFESKGVIDIAFSNS
jgi:spectinomycin phosphotransferase